MRLVARYLLALAAAVSLHGAEGLTAGEGASGRLRAVTIDALRVSQKGRVLRVSASAVGARSGQRYLFALMKGPEMWLAADVSLPVANVEIPEGLPGGTYDAVLLPHEALSPDPMRVPVTLPGGSAASVQAIGHGTYADSHGTPHRWYINRAGTLIWDGRPYIPAGAMFISTFLMSYQPGAAEQNEANFRDDLRRLRAMKEAGVTDLYLNPCAQWEDKPAWVWQRFADTCEEMGICYGIQVTNELRPLMYYDIVDGEYNATVRGTESAFADLPNTLLSAASVENEVLFAAFDATDDRLLEWGRAVVTPTASGVRAEAKRTIPSAGPVNVHFTPVYQYTGGIRDYWSSINSGYWTRLDRFFSSLKPGPGLRCWIDALDNEQSFQDAHNRRLPDSPGFRRALADYLRQKYPSAGDVAAAWALLGPVEDAGYEEFARLIPVGRPSPGADVQHLLDLETGRTFQIVPSRSAMWADVMQFRDRSVARFNMEVADRIKSHHDVPVVLKHQGSDLYINTRASGGFDGLGAEAYGTDNQHIRQVSASVHAASRQCGRTMWELTTETAMARPEVGYPGPLRIITELASMLEMGGKGTYVFLIKDANGHPMSDWYTFNLFEDARQIGWLGAYSRIIKAARALPEYTPETLSGDFPRDVLGLEMPAFGPSFEAVRFAGSFCVWNVTDGPLDLLAEAPAPHLPLGQREARTLTVAANADKALVIAKPWAVSEAAIEAANTAAALRKWNSAAAKLGEIGLDPGTAPAGGWQQSLSRAEELARRLGDAAAAPLGGVTVDGDLSEWGGLNPIFLKDASDVSDSRFAGAEVFLGYGEEHFYVAGSVADELISNSSPHARLWDGDAVEVFLDLNPDASPGVASLNGDCFQFIFAPTSLYGKPGMVAVTPSFSGPREPRHSEWAVRTDAAGWRFEAAINRRDLNGFEFRPGQVIGLEIQLDQSDGTGRSVTRLWHGGPDAFQNRLGYGRVVLGAKRPG